jgi:hypothetical protein
LGDYRGSFTDIGGVTDAVTDGGRRTRSGPS